MRGLVPFRHFESTLIWEDCQEVGDQWLQPSRDDPHFQDGDVGHFLSVYFFFGSVLIVRAHSCVFIVYTL